MTNHVGEAGFRFAARLLAGAKLASNADPTQ